MASVVRAQLISVHENKVLLDKKLRLRRMLLDITKMKGIRLRKELFTWMNWKVKLDHLDLASNLPLRPRLRNEP
jgi:hypothetical protein